MLAPTNSRTVTSGPVANLVSWSMKAQGELPPIDFDDAVGSFNKDCADLQGLDGDASSPSPSGYAAYTGFGGFFVPRPATDSDLRPGEVEVPRVGSLHSTPEGFQLERTEAPATLPGMPPRFQRFRY